MKRWIRRWISRFLCAICCHDWRNMDGVCAECGHHDEMWEA